MVYSQTDLEEAEEGLVFNGGFGQFPLVQEDRPSDPLEFVLLLYLGVMRLQVCDGFR